MNENESLRQPSSEEALVVGELHDTLVVFIEEQGIEIDPEDIDFLFTDGETHQPRDFDDALGAVYGFLVEEGFDPDEVLASNDI